MSPQERTLRRAVLAVAECAAADRGWILAQLEPAERDAVMSLLDALEGQAPTPGKASDEPQFPVAAAAVEAPSAAAPPAAPPDARAIQERIRALPARLQAQALAGAPAPVRDQLLQQSPAWGAAPTGAMLTPRAREALYAATLACAFAPSPAPPAAPRGAARSWWSRGRR